MKTSDHSLAIAAIPDEVVEYVKDDMYNNCNYHNDIAPLAFHVIARSVIDVIFYCS